MPRKSSRALWTEYLSGKSPGKTATATGSFAVKRGFDGHILGLDPSLRGTGFAVLKHQAGRFELLAHDTIRSSRSATSYECLCAIHRTIARVLEQFPVDHVACERIVYVQNVRTATAMGGARAAALIPAAAASYPIFEYSPLRIKQAITGNGRASKEQLGRTVSALLDSERSLALDESDAVAAAICHAFTYRPGEEGDE